MSSEVEGQLRQLAFFRDSSLKVKKAILKNCDRCFIDAIAEICGNYLLGNVHCDQNQFRQLAGHRQCLRKIINVTRLAAKRSKKSKTDSRRKILLQKGEGFWLALLPVVAELTSHYISQALKQ